jgi:hypothetical protein
MGEFVGFAAQILIFFAFTPVFVLSVVGGRVLDRRRADRNRRETMQRLGIETVTWRPAGQVTLAGSDLAMPELPAVPGLQRLEFLGPRRGQRHVTIAGAADLLGLWRNAPVGRRFAEHDMRSHLRLGGTVDVSYVDSITSREGLFDLADETNRQRAVAVLRQEAEIEAARRSVWSFG